MIFNSKETDFRNTVNFIDAFMAQGGLNKVCLDQRKLQEVISILYYDGYYHNGDLSKASVFKKVAVFILNFMAIRPIESMKDTENIKNSLSCLSSFENAVIAFEIARDSLTGAVMHRHGNDDVTLVNPIVISEHSYVEIIDAFARVSIQTGHLLLALLFEQMAYRSNPECSYEQIC